MNNRCFILCTEAYKSAAVIAVSAAVLVAGCAGHDAKAEKAGRVTHVVLCWLKEPGNPEHRQKILEVSRGLRAVPGVIDMYAGEAVASGRPIVDDSFDIGIVFTFADSAAMNAYLLHPLHKEAQENVLKPLVKRIVVYDIKE